MNVYSAQLLLDPHRDPFEWFLHDELESRFNTHSAEHWATEWQAYGMSKLYYFFLHEPVDPVVIRADQGDFSIHPGRCRIMGALTAARTEIAVRIISHRDPLSIDGLAPIITHCELVQQFPQHLPENVEGWVMQHCNTADRIPGTDIRTDNSQYVNHSRTVLAHTWEVQWRDAVLPLWGRSLDPVHRLVLDHTKPVYPVLRKFFSEVK